MPHRPTRKTFSRRRRRGAAIQLVLGGLLLMGVPAFLGDSAIAAGFRSLAPVAWLMLVGGAVLLLFPQRRTVREVSPSGAVPLNPEPVRVVVPEMPPLQRPHDDPLDRHGESAETGPGPGQLRS